MNKRCDVCWEDFQREPGYYFGAAYVSYGLTVGFGGFLFVILCGLFDFTALQYLLSFTGLLLLLLPPLYRASRLIWINFFVRYKKSER